MEDPGSDCGAAGLEPGWLPSAIPLLSEVSMPAKYIISLSLNDMKSVLLLRPHFSERSLLNKQYCENERISGSIAK